MAGVAVAKGAPEFDAIVIGAGLAGMYQLYKLRGLGLSVQGIEAGGDVGGTWYWNRYPGCRLDSESYTYSYSFIDELLQEWNWSEQFATQPEILKYLQTAADKMDIRKDYRFNSRVEMARYDENSNLWRVQLQGGDTVTCHYLVSAVGPLSAATYPTIDGIDDFKGESYHTYFWPHEDYGAGGKKISFADKRVAVIGTGATGIQVIQEVAKTAKELFVFQRNPNWAAPLLNSKISPVEMAEIKAQYSEIFEKCNNSHTGHKYRTVKKSALEVPVAEREAFWEKLYNEPGYAIWIGNYQDVLRDVDANRLMSDFIARKIRERVNDPAVAEKLIPKNHGFGLKRLPLEDGYYETYNQDNVHLIDLKETPIKRIVDRGIETSDAVYDLDMIIYATGFDAVTGSLLRMNIIGIDGQSLMEAWADGPKTYLGLQIKGFPNFFTILGAHNGATFCNIPRCAESQINWLTDMIQYLHENDLKYVEPSSDAQEKWTDLVYDVAEQTLFPKVNSWFNGDNANVTGRKRTFLLWAGGNLAYKAKCDDIRAHDYEGFVKR